MSQAEPATEPAASENTGDGPPLAFPYLHGYSVPTMDQLLGRRGFNRLKVYRDTLVTLSNSDTKAWARAEETFTKWMCRWVAGVGSLRESDSTSLAPWLDVYYGMGGVVAGTPVSVATTRSEPTPVQIQPR